MAPMSSGFVMGPAIVIGYTYRLQIETEAPVFPEGTALLAHVRLKPSSLNLLAALSSAAGTLLRRSDYLLEIMIPADATAQMQPGTVMFDLVRTDLDPPLHLGFSLEIPVQLPVTRGVL